MQKQTPERINGVGLDDELGGTPPKETNMETKTKIIGRRCGGCGRITPEVEYQAMKNTMDCPNPRCSDPKRAYAEKVLWSGPPNA